MSLDAMQRDIVRIAMNLPDAETIALAGGGAMLAHGFIDRVTHDLDLFTPDASAVVPVTAALVAALREHGYHVDIVRRHDTFTRLAVTDTAGEHTDVDIAQDAFLHEPVTLAIGRVIAADAVAANKTLALFGRAEARDLVDVDALTHHYSRNQLLELAAAADPGFDQTHFAEALQRASARPDTAFAEIGIDPQQLRQLRQKAREWASQLQHPDHPQATSAAQRRVAEMDPRILDDPNWPTLAAALDHATAQGIDIDAAITAIADRGELPDAHPARTLHYRLIEQIGATDSAASTSTGSPAKRPAPPPPGQPKPGTARPR